MRPSQSPSTHCGAIVLLLIATAGAVLAAETPSATAAAPAPPPIEVSIHGVLLDPEGKPLREGFVMAADDPYLCSLSDHAGRFRIEGRTWETPTALLASWAGCDTARVAVPGADAAEVTIRLQRQDPAFSAIEMGMTLKTRWFIIYDQSRPLSAAQKACVAAYAAFLRERGEAIIAKMLAGTALDADERRYECILASQLWMRSAQDVLANDKDPRPASAWCARTMTEFYRVSRKAIQRERLSAAEVHALRLAVAAYESSGYLPTCEYFLRKLGLGLPGAGAGGRLAADVPLIRFSPLLRSPEWSDVTSLSAGAHLRPEGLWGLFDVYWKWRIVDGRLLPTPPEEWRRRYHQDGVEITSLAEVVAQARGKPVVLSCQAFEDLTHPGFYTRQMEYLRRAYRGVADVYHVSQANTGAFVDVFTDEWSHFGRNRAADPLAGLDCARWEHRTWTPFRHARMTKVCAMNIPFVSGEMLLDSPPSSIDGRMTLHHNVVLDADGRVTAPFAGQDYIALPSAFFSNWYGSFATYNRLGGDSYWMALMHEQILRALIADGGRFSSGRPYGPGTWDRVRIQYPRTFHAKDDVFIVRSVDAERGVIHAGWFDPGHENRQKGAGNGLPLMDAPDAKATGDFVFRLQPDTRFSIRVIDGAVTWVAARGEESPRGATYRPGTLADFQPGTRFMATIRLPEPVSRDYTLAELTGPDNETRTKPGPFDMKHHAGKELVVHRLMNYAHHNSYGGSNPKFIPVYGTVTAKDGAVITVDIDREAVREMWGYRFWKEAETKGPNGGGAVFTPTHYWPRNAFWPSLKRWGDGSDADRRYRFRLDGATDVYRNGLVAEAGEVAVGDRVMVEYEIWWEHQGLHAEIIPPERFQASDPVIAPLEPALVAALRAQGMQGTRDELLARLRAPTIDLLPALVRAIASPDERARQDAVGAMELLVKAGADRAVVLAALEEGIAGATVPEETAFAWRRRFTAPAPFVRAWSVVGPFPGGLDIARGPETDGARLDRRYPGSAGEVAWNAHESPRDYIDGTAAIANAGGIVGYGACWIHVERAQTIALEIGSDDGCKVWVNRTLALRDPRARAAAPAQATAFARLEAGWNELLIKVDNGGGGWGWFLQLYGMDAKPLQARLSVRTPAP